MHLTESVLDAVLYALSYIMKPLRAFSGLFMQCLNCRGDWGFEPLQLFSQPP